MIWKKKTKWNKHHNGLNTHTLLTKTNRKREGSKSIVNTTSIGPWGKRAHAIWHIVVYAHKLCDNEQSQYWTIQPECSTTLFSRHDWEHWPSSSCLNACMYMCICNRPHLPLHQLMMMISLLLSQHHSSGSSGCRGPPAAPTHSGKKPLSGFKWTNMSPASLKDPFAPPSSILIIFIILILLSHLNWISLSAYAGGFSVHAS